MSKEKKDNSFVRLSARYVSGVLMLGAVTAGLFWAAGRWDWWQGWAFLGFFSIYINALSIWLAKTNPDLYAERSRIAENIEPWDHWVIRFYNASLIALILIGALDSGRWRWSSVTIWAQALGWIGLCLAAVLIWHVLAVNNFSSSWVRIQDDRNQKVVTHGAYRWIRHPMYLGVAMSSVCVPLVLASYWALVPGACVILVTVYRTAREDRTLLNKLDGYREYAQRVRFRLIPGIW